MEPMKSARCTVLSVALATFCGCAPLPSPAAPEFPVSSLHLKGDADAEWHNILHLPPAFAATNGLATAAALAVETAARQGADADALAALAAKADIAHSHDAGEIVSGVLDADRIPSIGIDKVLRLSYALDNKADLAHTHDVGDIVNLQSALSDYAPAWRISFPEDYTADDAQRRWWGFDPIPPWHLEEFDGQWYLADSQGQLMASLAYDETAGLATVESAMLPGIDGLKPGAIVASRVAYLGEVSSATNALSSALAAETAARQGADESLAASISAEARARANADNIETRYRQNADNAINARLDVQGDRVTGLETNAVLLATGYAVDDGYGATFIDQPQTITGITTHHAGGVSYQHPTALSVHGTLNIGVPDENTVENIQGTAFGAGRHVTATGAQSTALGYDAAATGGRALAAGLHSAASGNQAIALGAQSGAAHDNAFVWNGIETGSIAPHYLSHGAGTFSVNPNDGTAGFYVGEESLATLTGLRAVTNITGWAFTRSLTDEQKADLVQQDPGAADNGYAMDLRDDRDLYVGSFYAGIVTLSADGSEALFDMGAAALPWTMGEVVATRTSLSQYVLGSQEDKPLAPASIAIDLAAETAARQSADEALEDSLDTAANAIATLEANASPTRVWYATGASAASATAQVATTTGRDFKPKTGAIVVVRFTNACAAGNPTLNVDGTGALRVYCYQSMSGFSNGAPAWQAKSATAFMYDATETTPCWRLLTPAFGTTAKPGVVQLSTDTNSTTQVRAATSSAVKAVNDYALKLAARIDALETAIAKIQDAANGD